VVAMRTMPPLMPATKSTFRGEMLEGARYVFTEPVLSGILKLQIVYGLFEVNPTIIAIIGREILGVGPRELGFLLSAPAFGAFIGVLWLLLGERTNRQGRFSLCCTMAYSCVLVFAAFSTNYVLTFVALSIIGVLEVIMTVMRNSIMQLSAPEYMRGRVMANMGMVTRGISPLAETQSGLLASAIGPNFAALTAAGVVGIAAATTAIFNRALWNLSLSERPRRD
jgi:hypothetical protein